MKKKGLIFGVILVIIIITIAIVCYVLLKNKGYSDEEIAEFNMSIESFEGYSVDASEVKELVYQLIENAEINEKKEDFLPTVMFENTNKLVEAEGADIAVEDIEYYIENLTEINELIDEDYDYRIELKYEYRNSGLIKEIDIIQKYDLDITTRYTFNFPIEQYYGNSELGSDLRSLISTLIDNAATYEGQGDFLPTVELIGMDDTNSVVANGSEEAEEDGEAYISSLQDIESNLINSHYYSVTLNYSEFGLVNEIIITY